MKKRRPVGLKEYTYGREATPEEERKYLSPADQELLRQFRGGAPGNGPGVDGRTDPLAISSSRILNDPDAVWYDAWEVLAEFEVLKLFAARKAKGLTQKQLGEKLGVPQSRISYIEKHPTTISVGLLMQMAEALGVRVVLKAI